MERSQFLALGPVFAALGAAPAAQAPPAELARVDRALVLSGGGARGAYQAGVIDALSRGIPDGSPLRPYGFVCGTSIGALNAYYVATGQYSALRNLWYHAAEQNVVRLKRKYAQIVNPEGGVVTRIMQAVRLVMGMHGHERGVIDGEHVRDWLAAHIDPQNPVVMPVMWTVTNLSTQAPEFFYLIDRQLSSAARDRATAIIKGLVGEKAVLREATPDILVDALFASVAVPVAFDPIELPKVDGSARDLYVDGSITANTPIAAARAAARNVDIILLEPRVERETYRNALEIAVGAFGTMERRILEGDLRAAYLQGGVNLAQIQPEKELPVDALGFDQRDQIYATYKLGFEAALAGFKPYTFT